MPFNNNRNSRDDRSKKPRSNEGANPLGARSYKKRDSGNANSFGSKRGEFSRSDKPFNRSGSSDQEGNNNDSRPARSFGAGRPSRPQGSRSFGDSKREGQDSFRSSRGQDARPRNDRNAHKSDGPRSFERRSEGGSKPFQRRSDENGPRSFERRSEGGSKPFQRRSDENGPRSFERRSEGGSKPFQRRSDENGPRSFDRRSEGGSKPFQRRSDENGPRSFDRRSDGGSKPFPRRADEQGQPSKLRKRSSNAQNDGERDHDGLIRLNRYIANSGVCSRRKADELIIAGVVSVNGEVVTELGTRVDPSKDEIRYNGERLKREKMVYILLNKPKDYITTTEDPQERRTVMELVAKATRERIYPVGRLDRNTTGLLLLTNDGNLSEKLAHPRNNIRKIYHVELSKNLTQGDLNKIAFGLELEDGLIKPDEVTYVQGASKREIGIQIHSGKNRIVRRIFEHLGYEVVKLDRVIYANLTKKDLPRGRWRYLEEKEITQLKHLIH
jgi:23S rRNA pseudouridine2605 synthase